MVMDMSEVTEPWIWVTADAWLLSVFGSGSLPPTTAVLVIVPGDGGAVTLMVIVTVAPTARLPTVQLTVPDGLRGRVMSLHTLMFAGVTPFGAFLMGSVAEAAGVKAALLVSGGGGLISVLALLAWWNGRDRGPSLAARPQGGSA